MGFHLSCGSTVKCTNETFKSSYLVLAAHQFTAHLYQQQNTEGSLAADEDLISF